MTGLKPAAEARLQAVSKSCLTAASRKSIALSSSFLVRQKRRKIHFKTIQNKTTFRQVTENKTTFGQVTEQQLIGVEQ